MSYGCTPYSYEHSHKLCSKLLFAAFPVILCLMMLQLAPQPTMCSRVLFLYPSRLQVPANSMHVHPAGAVIPTLASSKEVVVVKVAIGHGGHVQDEQLHINNHNDIVGRTDEELVAGALQQEKDNVTTADRECINCAPASSKAAAGGSHVRSAAPNIRSGDKYYRSAADRPPQLEQSMRRSGFMSSYDSASDEYNNDWMRGYKMNRRYPVPPSGPNPAGNDNINAAQRP